MLRPVSFAIVQATNVSLVYTIDAYRPVAGEVIVSQLGFKCKHILETPRDLQLGHHANSSLFVSCLRLLALLLYESVDCTGRLQSCFRSHGWHKRCDLDLVDSVLHLRETHSGSKFEMACDEGIDPLGSGQRGWRVICVYLIANTTLAGTS